MNCLGFMFCYSLSYFFSKYLLRGKVGIKIDMMFIFGKYSLVWYLDKLRDYLD